MARKKKKQFEEQGASAGFVPASLETAHSARTRTQSFSFDDSNVPTGVEPGSYEQYSRNMANYSQRRKQNKKTGSKVALGIVVAALVAAVAALGFFVAKEIQKQNINNDLHDVSKAVMAAIDNELTGMTTFDEPFTVLLLGSDERTGEDEVDIGARTDTIVLVRIDPTQNIISMVSVPRDTKVEIDGAGTEKINAAFNYGGPSATIAAVKKLCGVEIDHYAEINFDGLVGLVDAIGGIDVHNDELIDDPNAGWVVIPEGDVHLDGVGALTFARSRAYADGDFTRVSNQRKVIEAIVHKGLEAPASELYGLIRASTTFLTTDTAMDVDFIFSLADQIRHNNDYPVQLFSATIPASTDMIGGVSYVIADRQGVDEMMKVLLAGGDVSASAESEEEAEGVEGAKGAEGVVEGATTGATSTNVGTGAGASTSTGTGTGTGRAA